MAPIQAARTRGTAIRDSADAEVLREGRTTQRRRTRAACRLIAAAATLAGIAAILLGPGGDSVATAGAQPPIHVPLWVPPETVQRTPRFRFTFDSPETLAALRREERLDEIVHGASSDLERFQLLNRWVRAQFEPGRPDPYPPIDARVILRDIRRGFTGGFCAQYCYVLAQSLQALD